MAMQEVDRRLQGEREEHGDDEIGQQTSELFDRGESQQGDGHSHSQPDDEGCADKRFLDHRSSS